jgi:hypothetical protein
MKNFVKDTVGHFTVEQQLTLRMPAALAEKLERVARRLRRRRSEAETIPAIRALVSRNTCHRLASIPFSVIAFALLL